MFKSENGPSRTLLHQIKNISTTLDKRSPINKTYQIYIGQPLGCILKKTRSYKVLLQRQRQQ